MVNVSRHNDWFRAAVGVAGRQHGVVTLAQLLAIGVSRTTVESWLRAGRLTRLYRGVYAVGHDALRSEGRWLAAVWACGEGAALSHRPALALHALKPTSALLTDVSVPARRRARKGIRLTQTTFLPGDVVEVRGVPVTSPTRTIIDMTSLLPARQLEYLMALADRRGELDHARLPTLAAEPQLTRSEDEAILLEALRAAGLPVPEANPWVTHGGGEEWQPDFVYWDVRLIVEIDDDSHKTPASFELDREKDTVRQDDGWTVRRVTRRQVRERLPWVVERIANAYFTLKRAACAAR